MPEVKFGKHKGKDWSEVPESYLLWAKGQEGRIKEQADEELARRSTGASPVATQAPVAPAQTPLSAPTKREPDWDAKDKRIVHQHSQTVAATILAANADGKPVLADTVKKLAKELTDDVYEVSQASQEEPAPSDNDRGELDEIPF